MHSFIPSLVAVLPLAAAAPFHLQPRDSNAGCTANSQGSFAWTVENFAYQASWTFSTPAHQIASGTATFNLTNPALAYPVSCSATSEQLQYFFFGTQNYRCVAPESDTTVTDFNFNYASGQLNVNQTWVCADTDPQWPATFSDAGSVNLTMSCNDTGTQVTSNWTVGQIYSTREVVCDLLTVPMKPYQISAVA